MSSCYAWTMGMIGGRLYCARTMLAHRTIYEWTRGVLELCSYAAITIAPVWNLRQAIFDGSQHFIRSMAANTFCDGSLHLVHSMAANMFVRSHCFIFFLLAGSQKLQVFDGCQYFLGTVPVATCNLGVRVVGRALTGSHQDACLSTE